MKDIQSISNEIRGKAKNLSGIKIISLAIFGSTARRASHADSDVDLLVVAEGIAKKRIQRIPDIVKIKRELNLGFPLDILLVSKNECQLNFRNHNPLYLDIALDAEIIYDTGFLKNLIKETREYIDSNNIRRGVDSWSFLQDSWSELDDSQKRCN
jgi:predicted nucleotidyltransferase